MYVLRLNT